MAKKEEIRDWTAGTEGFIAEVLEIQEKEGFTAALAAYLNNRLQLAASPQLSLETLAFRRKNE